MINTNVYDKYFLNKENIYKLNKKFIKIEKRNNEQVKKKNVITTPKDKNDFFIPEPEDSLLWCWIIFHEGIKEYYLQTEFSKIQNLFSYEKQSKIQLIYKLRENKKLLKQHKLKLSDIENNLMYEDKTTLNTLTALSIVYSYNLIVIQDKIYWEKILILDNLKTLCIKKVNDKYSINLEQFDKFDLKKNKIIVENINKPLKAISSYKVNEIRDLCKKFNINVMKSPTKYKTKKDLYLLLQEQF